MKLKNHRLFSLLFAGAIALLNDLSTHPIALSSLVTHPHPSKFDMIDSVTPDEFAGLIDLLNHEPGSVARYLPLMVHELEQGVTTTFVGVASGDLLDPDAPTPIPGTAEAYLLEAEDIGVAFVIAPEQEPDTSCIADLFPDFVLPLEVKPMPVSATTNISIKHAI